MAGDDLTSPWRPSRSTEPLVPPAGRSRPWRAGIRQSRVVAQSFSSLKSLVSSYGPWRCCRMQVPVSVSEVVVCVRGILGRPQATVRTSVGCRWRIGCCSACHPFNVEEPAWASSREVTRARAARKRRAQPSAALRNVWYQLVSSRQQCSRRAQRNPRATRIGERRSFQLAKVKEIRTSKRDLHSIHEHSKMKRRVSTMLTAPVKRVRARLPNIDLKFTGEHWFEQLNWDRKESVIRLAVQKTHSTPANIQSVQGHCSNDHVKSELFKNMIAWIDECSLASSNTSAKC